MKFWVSLFLLLTCAQAQQLEFLDRSANGKAARDAQGNWIYAEQSNGDLRVRKLSADFRQTLFDITTGGSSEEIAYGLQVDAAGNAYVLGVTLSKDFPETPNAPWLPAAAAGQAFFLKVDAAGAIATSTYLPIVATPAFPPSFVAAANGDWIVAATAVGGTSGTGTLLLMRIAQDGTQARGSRAVDAGAAPMIAAMQRDAAGSLFVAGTTSASDFPATPGAYEQTLPTVGCPGSTFGPSFPCTSGFVMKLDGADYHTLAATYLGGAESVTLTGLAVDAQGSPYVTGTVGNPLTAGGGANSYPVTAGAFQGVPAAGGFHGVVTKLSTDLTGLTYSTFLGGSRNDRASAIAVDSEGRAIVSGGTNSVNFPATGVFGALCGPDYLNAPEKGFVSRLTADGSGLDRSVIVDRNASLQFLEAGDPVVAVSPGLVRVDLAANGPAAACTVNGANFRREDFVGPGQLITVIGGPFPPEARLLFDGAAATLLYVGAQQINAIVPRSAAGSAATTMEIEIDGVRSNARQFAVRSANPTVMLWIAPDGSVDNRGNLLADVALSDGSTNTEANPAHVGEVVTVYTSGLDLSRPVRVQLNAIDVPVLRISDIPGTFGAVQGVDLKIPGPAAGLYVIRIQNGDAFTADNAGFVWTQ